MADALTPVKDPSKNKFWRPRNMVLLVATGVLPLIGTSFWNWATERMESFWSYDKRLRELEANAASEQAVWGAVRDLTTKHAAVEQQMLVIQKLFDREWGRGAGMAQQDYISKIGELDEQLRAVRESQRQLNILIREHKAKNPDSKTGEVPQLPQSKVDWAKFVQAVPAGSPAGSSTAIDPDMIKDMYEKRFPKVAAPNMQQQKK
jgi:hypothetical protein